MRMWYQNFDSYIWQLGYHRFDSDPCMYTRQLVDESRMYLILYVDDMLIAGSNQAEIGKLNGAFTTNSCVSKRLSITSSSI